MKCCRNELVVRKDMKTKVMYRQQRSRSRAYVLMKWRKERYKSDAKERRKRKFIVSNITKEENNSFTKAVDKSIIKKEIRSTTMKVIQKKKIK